MKVIIVVQRAKQVVLEMSSDHEMFVVLAGVHVGRVAVVIVGEDGRVIRSGGKPHEVIVGIAHGNQNKTK